MNNFADFVRVNGDADCARLLLQSTSWPESPLKGIAARDLCVSTIEVRRRLRTKLPRWHADPGLAYPNRLCGEQCSSESTARYKAKLASQILSETDIRDRRIADLTGGLGADSMELSTICNRLLYNEMNPILCAATKYNFGRIGVSNVDFSSVMVDSSNLHDLLDTFSPNLVFLDPARRSETGRKVFLLEDCSPDLMTLKDKLLDIAGDLMVKLSPMADISMLIEKLGACVREIHIVGSGGVHGECKELLVWMQRGWKGGATLVCADADMDGSCFRFTMEMENTANSTFPSNTKWLENENIGSMLFEPSSAMMKAGPYRLLGERFGMVRLGRGVQLYLARPGQEGNELRQFGKMFIIKNIRLFGKAEIKAVAKDYPRCEVTARNLPITSEELKKKMGVESGSNVHVFAVGCDFEDRNSARYLLVCESLN